jgi:hypothetical protein
MTRPSDVDPLSFVRSEFMRVKKWQHQFGNFRFPGLKPLRSVRIAVFDRASNYINGRQHTIKPF